MAIFAATYEGIVAVGSLAGSFPGPRLPPGSLSRHGLPDQGRRRSGEADVQDEMPQLEVEVSAAGPVHDECQEDDH
jgi:hypothetical protein